MPDAFSAARTPAVNPQQMRWAMKALHLTWPLPLFQMATFEMLFRMRRLPGD
jgi:hypothetical protein